jgi:hypothetical protein
VGARQEKNSKETEVRKHNRSWESGENMSSWSLDHDTELFTSFGEEATRSILRDRIGN